MNLIEFDSKTKNKPKWLEYIVKNYTGVKSGWEYSGNSFIHIFQYKHQNWDNNYHIFIYKDPAINIFRLLVKWQKDYLIKPEISEYAYDIIKDLNIYTLYEFLKDNWRKIIIYLHSFLNKHIIIYEYKDLYNNTINRFSLCLTSNQIILRLYLKNENKKILIIDELIFNLNITISRIHIPNNISINLNQYIIYITNISNIVNKIMELNREQLIILKKIYNNIYYDIVKFMINDYANEYIIADLCKI
jgi:hypothetical protein